MHIVESNKLNNNKYEYELWIGYVHKKRRLLNFNLNRYEKIKDIQFSKLSHVIARLKLK